MSKIYVPDYTSSNCVIVRNEEVIRRYETTPTYNSTVNYIDYYIHTDYIAQPGNQTFNQYSTLPTCLSSDIITTDIYYRVDMYKILIMFLIISIFAIGIPLKVFSRLIRRLQ